MQKPVSLLQLYHFFSYEYLKLAMKAYSSFYIIFTLIYRLSDVCLTIVDSYSFLVFEQLFSWLTVNRCCSPDVRDNSFLSRFCFLNSVLINWSTNSFIVSTDMQLHTTNAVSVGEATKLPKTLTVSTALRYGSVAGSGLPIYTQSRDFLPALLLIGSRQIYTSPFPTSASICKLAFISQFHIQKFVLFIAFLIDNLKEIFKRWKISLSDTVYLPVTEYVGLLYFVDVI